MILWSIIGLKVNICLKNIFYNPWSLDFLLLLFSGVFPLILDVEQKAAEKVIECIFDVLINNIVGFSDAMHTRHFLPWKILQATEKCKMTSYLSRACGQWAKNGLLKSRMLKFLKTHLDTENSNSAWLLLALITSHVPLDNPKVRSRAQSYILF